MGERKAANTTTSFASSCYTQVMNKHPIFSIADILTEHLAHISILLEYLKY